MNVFHNGEMVKKMNMTGRNERMLGKLFEIGLCKNLEGFITDFNIFNRLFDENENVFWTICRGFEKGDVFSWTEDFEKLEIPNSTNIPHGWGIVVDEGLVTEIAEVDENEICIENSSDKIELFFSGPISNYDADNICQEMNGDFLLLPETGEELKFLKDAIISYKTKTNLSPWSGHGGDGDHGLVELPVWIIPQRKRTTTHHQEDTNIMTEKLEKTSSLMRVSSKKCGLRPTATTIFQKFAKQQQTFLFGTQTKVFCL